MDKIDQMSERLPKFLVRGLAMAGIIAGGATVANAGSSSANETSNSNPSTLVVEGKNQVQTAYDELMAGKKVEQAQVSTPEAVTQTPGWQFVAYNQAQDIYESVNMDTAPYMDLLNRIDFIGNAKMKELYPDTPDDALYINILNTHLDSNGNVVPTIVPVATPTQDGSSATEFTPFTKILLDPNYRPLHAVGTLGTDGKVYDLGLNKLLEKTGLNKNQLDFTSQGSLVTGQIFFPTQDGKQLLLGNGRTLNIATLTEANGSSNLQVLFVPDPKNSSNWISVDALPADKGFNPVSPTELANLNMKTGIDFTYNGFKIQIVTDVPGIDFRGIDLAHFDDAMKKLGIDGNVRSNTIVQILNNPTRANHKGHVPDIIGDNTGNDMEIMQDPEILPDGTQIFKSYLDGNTVQGWNHVKTFPDGVTRNRVDGLMDQMIFTTLLAGERDPQVIFDAVIRKVGAYPDVIQTQLTPAERLTS